MRLAVLGPVVTNNSRAPIVGKGALLLALLVEGHPHQVGVSRLCEGLSVSRQALQVIVSRLRKKLDFDIVNTRSGYRFAEVDGSNLADGSIDWVVFESRVAASDSGDPSADLAELRLALSLVRPGGLAAGLDDALVLEPFRKRVADALLFAELREVELLIALGSPEAVRLAAALAARDALGEQSHELYLRALQQVGRSVEALREFERFRSEHVSETGMEPGTRLRELYVEILNFGPVLPSDEIRDSRIEQPEEPLAESLLYGREHELAMLADLSVSAVCCVGEPGIGKTALATASIEALREQGSFVAAVRCPPNPPRPLAAIVALIRAIEPGDLAESENPIGAWALSDSPAEQIPFLSRDSLIESAIDLLSDLCVAKKATLVIDDAQWLDSTGASIVLGIIAVGRARVRAFSRDLSNLSPAISSKSCEVLSLAGLAVEAVQGFLEDRYPRLLSNLFELHHASGGNPLLLEQFAVALVEGDTRNGGLPGSLLLTTKQRLSQISPAGIEVLNQAAVLGEQFPVEVLVAMNSGEISSFITELEGSGLLHRLADDPTVLCFTHSLIAQAVRSLTSPAHLVDLHHLSATTLLSLGYHATVVAHHAIESSGIDPVLAAATLVDAGTSHLAVFGDAEAKRYFAQAIEIIERSSAPVSALIVVARIGLGRSLRRLGDAGHVDVLLRCAADARTLGDKHLCAEAAIELCAHSGTTEIGPPAEVVIDHVLAVLKLELEDIDLLRLKASSAVLLSFSDHHDLGQKYFADAVDALENIESPAIRREVLMNTHMGIQDPFALPRRELAAAMLSEVAEDDADARWEAAYLDFMHGVILADRDRVERSAEVISSIGDDELRRPRTVGRFCTSLAMSLLFGDRFAARANFEATLEAAPGSTDTLNAGLFAVGDFISAEAAEILPERVTALRDWTSQIPGTGARSLYVAALADKGEYALARSLIERALSEDAMNALDHSWTLATMAWARTAAALADAEASARIHSALMPLSGSVAWAIVLPYLPVDLSLASLAHAMGDNAAAIKHLGIAREVANSIGSPWFLSATEQAAQSIEA